LTSLKTQNGMTGALVKTSLVDYPGKVAAAYFVRGCNLRCPYCYNRELVIGESETNNAHAATAAEVIAHLKKRKDVLTGFVLSGGEPLLSPGTAELVSAARGLGYFVKLDTNGTTPEILERFLSSPDTCPDYVALDIKTSPERYHLLFSERDYQKEVLRSVEILRRLAPDAREFRTVLVPPLVGKEDILAIARILPMDALWFFAPFKNGSCLDPSYNGIAPYTDTEAEHLVQAAGEIIPGAQMR
jgi:pyruvate formate lyase activating enzyme